MENYFKRKSDVLEILPQFRDSKDIPSDPGQRYRIMEYNPNDRDEVRRAYLIKGATQPSEQIFPLRQFGGQKRKFNPVWYGKHAYWLEYSISKDAIYCLCCYLFKSDIGHQAGGDRFVNEGFLNWKTATKSLIDHENSIPHREAVSNCQNLLNPKQHIETIFSKISDKDKAEYKLRLNTAIEAVRYLSTQGLAFRGHDESESSSNKGNYIELIDTFRRISLDVKLVTLENAPRNHKMTCPEIQKDIVRAYAMEIMKKIMNDLGDAHFCLMVDESRDISIKEQMALVIRYVNRKGNVIERFLGIEHVRDTNSLTLKATIDDVLCRNGMSISKLRGQGYDGASNMKGEYNGLKSLILKENACAYYIHCFAHQLQLALVAVSRKNDHVCTLFDFIGRVLNSVGSSCKRRDMIREKQFQRKIEALNIGEISSGTGLNQETSLKRPGDTRWSSHYNTLLSLTNMFGEVIEVLEIIGKDAPNSTNRTEAQDIVDRLLSFDFIFSLFLMKKILAITNELSQALQRKDQDIVNAMTLVKVSKRQLQTFRQDGWDSLLESVSKFCEKYKVSVPEMDAIYHARGRSRRNENEITNLRHFQAGTFYAILDIQFGELDARFSDSTMILLLCVACLDPSNNFSQFDKEKLVVLAKFYPQDFAESDIWKLEDQLDSYIADVRFSNDFFGLKGISDLAQKMVECGRNIVYPLVYLLLTLALTLPVATASVERVFSAMHILKTKLRNRMNDEWLNDALLIFIERDISKEIENTTIMDIFQKMKTRKGQL